MNHDRHVYINMNVTTTNSQSRKHDAHFSTSTNKQCKAIHQIFRFRKTRNESCDENYNEQNIFKSQVLKKIQYRFSDFTKPQSNLTMV